MASRIAAGALAVVAVLVATLIVTAGASGGDGSTLKLTVPRATGLIEGFDVRAGGVPVGSVKKVELRDDYRVDVELDFDDTVWPLPDDTRFAIRMGGTIKYSDRYVALKRGSSKRNFEPDQQVPAKQFINPVEFDQVFKIFDKRTRDNLNALLEEGGRAAPLVGKNAPRALEHWPAAANSVEQVVRQLGDDPEALDTLVRQTAAVSRSLAASNPSLGAMIESTGTTLEAVASRAQDFERTLGEAPATLAAARTTAARVDETLVRARDLTARLKPGVSRLRRVSPPLAHLLGTVVDVGPDARRTLATLDRSVPDLNKLVDRARSSLMPRVETIGKEAAKQLNCLRPYTPEIMGFASNWANTWSRGDGLDKYFRAAIGAILPTPLTEYGVDSEVASRAFRDTGAMRYAFPRPAGANVNQPWFQPQCGITKDSFDVTKDPESKFFHENIAKRKTVDFTNGKPVPRSTPLKALKGGKR